MIYSKKRFFETFPKVFETAIKSPKFCRLYESCTARFSDKPTPERGVVVFPTIHELHDKELSECIETLAHEMSHAQELGLDSIEDEILAFTNSFIVLEELGMESLRKDLFKGYKEGDVTKYTKNLFKAYRAYYANKMDHPLVRKLLKTKTGSLYAYYIPR